MQLYLRLIFLGMYIILFSALIGYCIVQGILTTIGSIIVGALFGTTIKILENWVREGEY